MCSPFVWVDVCYAAVCSVAKFPVYYPSFSFPWQTLMWEAIFYFFLSYFYKQPPRFVYVYVVVSCMCCEKTGKRNHSWSSIFPVTLYKSWGNKIIMISIIWASSSRSAGNWTTQPSLQLGFHQLDILVKMGQSSSISDVGWYWWDERLEMTPDELTQGQL